MPLVRRPPSCELVVARYNEEIAWTHGFKGCRRTVYNKGRPLDGNVTDISSLTLPNVGREVHTYLSHIVSRYATLANTTIFFQGAINTRKEQSLGPFKRYMDNGVDSFYGSNVRWASDPFTWRYPSPARYQRQRPGHGMSAYTLGVFFAVVLQRDYRTSGPNRTRWIPGAYFSVGRNLVHRNSRRYYQRILNSANLSVHIDPEEVHYMERGWRSIFLGDGIRSRARD